MSEFKVIQNSEANMVCIILFEIPEYKTLLCPESCEFELYTAMYIIYVYFRPIYCILYKLYVVYPSIKSSFPPEKLF